MKVCRFWHIKLQKHKVGASLKSWKQVRNLKPRRLREDIVFIPPDRWNQQVSIFNRPDLQHFIHLFIYYINGINPPTEACGSHLLRVRSGPVRFGFGSPCRCNSWDLDQFWQDQFSWIRFQGLVASSADMFDSSAGSEHRRWFGLKLQTRACCRALSQRLYDVKCHHVPKNIRWPPTK